MTTKQLDIVIVSYNTVEMTLRAIASVYEQTKHTRFNLIVVDNNSHDGSADAIEEQFPDVHLIRSLDNTGFAGGINTGSRVYTSEHLLFLNPDTVILDGAIDKLYAFANEKPRNGIWGGITLNNDHSINTHNAWAKPSTQTLLSSALGLSKAFKNSCFFNNANYGCWPRDSVKTVDILQGCFFLTTRELWESIGGFDETFFMYGEEGDYCLKAIAKGKQPIITPEAKIIHHGGASEVNLSGKMIKLLKAKVELVNRHSRPLERPLHRGLLFTYVLNQLVTHQILSLIKPQHKARLAEWKTIFKARHDWLKGWV